MNVLYSRWLHYPAIGLIHLGLLLLPVGGAKAGVITIQVGQSQTYLSNNRVQQNTTDTDTPLTGHAWLSVYQEADLIDYPIYASDGTPDTEYQLVYDAQAANIPEVPTWLMVSLGVLLIGVKITKKQCHLAKALLASPYNVAC